MILKKYISKTKGETKGVISLEACIVLPIFIFLLMFFYGFFVFFSGQQVITHAMIQSADSLSLDPYAMERIDNSKLESGGDLIQALYGTLFTDQSKYFVSDDKWYSDDKDKLPEVVKNRFIGYLAGDCDKGVSDAQIEHAANELLKTAGVQGGLDGMDFSASKVDGNKLTITVKYKQEFIFNFQGLAAFDREQTLNISLWDV